ncbi:imidazolonepropionase-like amidohydrolase [Runella defluvii]|uniref:Imidazolonepropionase-like amidohydrolase n=1 Tax=Runella defluvii TaxID=370973 RepID=A0A7W5ZIA0_9BACT|nr:amidohydrolase family protein [Runella defluvii]MBB3836374.1 imidazolonepropionase-like amidohydrolase [Runella defluvii]
MKKIITLLITLAVTSAVRAQTPTFPRNGVYDERPEMYAFTNATIYVDARTVVENATLLIKNGIVVAAAKDVQIPSGTVVTDLKGRRIYPALIDMESDYGMPEIARGQRGGRGFSPQIESNKKGAYGWNQAVNADAEAGKIFTLNTTKADELRKLGFGAVLTHHHDGIVRGTGALVSLSSESENSTVLRHPASFHLSFSKGTSTQQYPNSPMGSMALLRQTYYDAEWYKNSGKNVEFNLSLEAFNKHTSLPTIFEATDKWSLLRADKLGDEFKTQYIFRGSGDEYQRVDEIKAAGGSIIVPINYPSAFDVEDAWDADNVSLAEMKHWEMAPANAATLEKAGVNFVLTSALLKTKTEFWPNLRKAIEHGLSETKALEALTTIPAQLLQCSDKIGSLKTGTWANFIITSGSIFSADNILYENWIRGKKYVINSLSQTDIRGTYQLNLNDEKGKLVITGKPDKPDYQVVLRDTVKITPKVTFLNDVISINFQPDRRTPNATTRLTGYLEGTTLKGSGENAKGEAIKWAATFQEAYKAPETRRDSTQRPVPNVGKPLYPFVGFGNTEKPKSETILVKNATVWTSEDAGVLTNTDVLVENGKITKVGKNLSAATARVIDGTGKHLTPGIIDEHSHIALASVNEGGQSSSAEVRMSDVVNPDDINIYRQLAGGVTMSQLLHGSANSIGGQSAVVKLKWGSNVNEMLVPEAQYIKFALGENVKQSNSPNATIRYPQTRMGVEQVFYDHFIRAREYDRSWDAYNSMKNKIGVPAPRRDIELETLAEILNGKRFITCHSYVQSEINMLIKVADSLGFKINTFTHILEGYKVADKMKKHGVAGSSFADWWAYKMEVKDAIPYNAAILAKVGVLTSINSDDAEMARRLNQEAAKAVEYGGIAETEALKMVTINPAKILRLDKRTGSIKVGKDADLVLWNNHPLSIYARPDYTIVEGAICYSTDGDDKRRGEVEQERARLIQKMISAKTGGATAVRPPFRRQRMWHCEDVEGIMAEGEEEGK